MIINGTSGQDNLEAKKNDQLFGFEGDDILDASNGQGSNLLDGGSGNDKLVGNNQDTLKGGAGTDSLYALGSSGFNTLEGGEDNDQLFVVEGGNNTLSGESGNDTLTVSGGSGNNTLNGGIGNDKLDVSNLTGNNILNGNEGDDILVGGLGSDQLFGGSGDDLLFGGVKGSKLTGGTGADKFYLASAAIPEVAIEVLDFTQGEDKIIIEGIPEIANFANLILTQTGSDTTVKANIGGSVKSLGILKNIQANILTPNDFNFIVPIFSITSASATEGNAINFTVTRTEDAQSNQSVNVSTSIATGDTASANDLIANTQTFTFASGETTKTFTVQTSQDVLFEGNETFTVSLSNPTNGAIISPSNGTAKGTINNDDSAPIFSIVDASATEGNAINFTVTRTGDAQSNQSVNVSTSIATGDTASANDLIANTQTFTFASGETTKTFTVQTSQDVLFEGNETFTVSLSNSTNGAIISPSNGTAKGTINNDDSAPNKKPTLQNFTQNGQEDQIISFGIGDFTNKGKYQDEDNNDLIAIKVISLPTTGSLTFVNGQQVTVNQEISVNDLANVRYNPVANANGNVATFTIAAIDNGTPKAESDPATITINLTPVNDPPIAQNDQLSVSQGSLGTINPLNNDSDPDGDNLKIAGKTDGKYGKVDINGNNLTYTLLDANYLGNDVFSYTVSDGSLSASANVRVTVTAKAASGTVAPTQLISIAPGDKLIPQEAGALTGIVDKLAYRFSDYNPSLVKNSLQNALNQTSAAFNNLFGLYEVDDETGAVNGIKPGESGYAKAALSKVVDNFIVRVGGLSSGAASDVVVTRGKIYSPFAIANGGNFSGNIQQAINAFLAANPNNSPANAQNYTTLPVAYFSFGVANPDGAAHLKSFGNNTFGFEDLPAGVGVSDYDFNDTMFSFGGIA
ncbi:MAG: cadherin-like domain-containing protein [Aphanizomenon flos-aquae DEX188]|nr:MAG: cadherin-like domain-containing protein [Aphanizomenon flos-aquae DEX188]